MNRVKVHLAPSFSGMVHDTIPNYRNTVPFCEDGIKQWCELVPQPYAELIHIGQVPVEADRPFPYERHPQTTVVDIEGDYLPGSFREEFSDITTVCCGAPPEWRGRNVFPRPTMSIGLVHAARYRKDEFRPPEFPCLGFIGKWDKSGVRHKIMEAGHGISANISLNSQWHGPTGVDSLSSRLFFEFMEHCSVAICPQGEGIATARFYEACFYSRCPLVVGETMILGEEWADTSFILKMDSSLSVDQMRSVFQSILCMSMDEARDRGRMAREYFDNVVRPYFKDPTECFLNWLSTK